MCEIVPATRHLFSLLLAGLAAFPALADLRPAAVPGGVASVRIAPASQARPDVRFAGKQVLLRRQADGWYALVGLPLDTAPGEQVLEVGPERRPLPFPVTPRSYPEQRLTIKNPKMVTPDPDDLARIELERELQIAVRSRYRDVDVPRVDLDLPASGRLSSRFGLRRIFNGEPRAPHTGLDVAVPAGTPVRAPADGVVSLVEDFYFNGRTVFVDHGQGFVSMVCHLDKAQVDVGQTVRRGAPLGLSGSSGRATGPHLHWSVYLNGAPVDPALFIEPPPAR